MQFVAIDLETPNQRQDSVCAIGAIRFTDGVPDETHFYELIDPNTHFDELNIEIHKIEPGHVKNKPSFANIWPKLREYLGDSILVAHNAHSTEKPVLNKCLRSFDHSEIRNNFLCTLKLSEAILPGAASHKLPALSNLFGLDLEHHNALSDAKACGELAALTLRLISLDLRDELTLKDIENATAAWQRSHRNSVRSINPKSTTARSGRNYGGHDRTERDVDNVIHDGRFEGMRFVLTIDMSKLNRDRAEYHIRKNGGEVTSSVSGKTDFVVVGTNSDNKYWAEYEENGNRTSKWDKGLKREQVGEDIRVVFEDTFYEMLKTTAPETLLSTLPRGTTEKSPS